jgi:hypothetical protein
MLLAYAWQHFLWDTPYTVFLWDEGLFQGFAASQKIEWGRWTDEIFSFDHISMFAHILAVIFVLTAVSIVVEKPLFLKNLLLFTSGFFLLFYAILSCKDQYYRPVQFLEFSIQWTLLFILLFYNSLINKALLNKILICCVSLTFLAHGFYALNIYPVPTSFVNMSMNILSVNEQNARLFLKIMGVLDLLACVMFWMPKTRKSALVYCLVWGFLTAFARIIANIHVADLASCLTRYSYEFLMRVPHFLIPFYLLKNEKSKLGMRNK